MLSRFLSYLRYELNRAQLTVDAYERDIRQFCQWLGKENPEEVDFTSVTSSDARSWLASLSRKGENPRTVRRKAQSLRALFRWMLKCRIIKSSPMRDIPLPKLTKPLPDFVKPREIEAALHHDEEELNTLQFMETLIVEMFYSLGIRRAELLSINDSDISKTGGELKVTGKRSKQRVIPLPQILLQKIEKWQQLRDNEWPDSVQTDSPLFAVKGKRLTPQRVYNIVHKALQGSTARKRSPHALRHSFASAMLNGGADIDSVREFLGHASLATTQIYTHISLKEIKNIYSSSHPRSGEKDKE